MQSPTGVLFRTMVMLACLVAIPMAALFGTSLPKMMTAILEGRWPLAASGRTVQQSGNPELAPANANGSVIANPAEPASPMWQPYPPKRGDIPGDTLALPQSAVTPAAYQATTAPSGGSAEVQSAVATVLSNSMGSRTAMPNVPAPMAPAGAASAAASSSGDRGNMPHTDYFTQIQQRLRQLGATYYLLETWGNRRELYRFYCEVPIGGSPNFVRHFEATHTEPLEAMAQVLQEVESSRAARR